MIKQISDLVKEYGRDAVVNNPEIPNEENNSILAEATNTITGGMQNMLAGGGLKDIISMFTGAGNNQAGPGGGGMGKLLKNPIVAMMVGHLISKLVGKFKMNPSQASNVANQLVPNVLGGLVNRTMSNDPENDAFDLNDLIGSLTGGNVATSEVDQSGFNFQEMLNQVSGRDGGSMPGDGDGFDLQDIISQVTQGAIQNKEQQAKSGSGLIDLVKGFFT